MKVLNLPGRRAIDAVRSWWLWLVPLAVLYATLRWPTGRVTLLTAGLVAVGVLAWAIRRPASALIALLVFLPLQEIGFGFLLRLGVAPRILRPAGGLKEVLAAGILLSALHAIRTRRIDGERNQLDAIDKAALIYVAVATLYVVSPGLFTAWPVSHRWGVRLLAWRGDCAYVLLFFAVRHAPIAASARRRFQRAVIVLTALTVIAGFYQWLRPASWSYLVLVRGRQLQYQFSVLGISPATVLRNVGYLTNLHVLRVGSVFLSPFDMSDFLLIPLAFAVERIARGDRSWRRYLLCAVIVAAMFASRVRADALAAIVLAVIALVPLPHRPVAARFRLLAAICVAAALVIPSLGGTRFVNGEGGVSSNQGHISELNGGLAEIARNPLGIGIGNVAGVGDRFVLSADRQGGFTVDNSVLQVADELGIQALLPWLVMVILIWRALGRAARRTDPFAGGIRLAFLALFVAGMYHHVFLSFPVAWTLWAGVGLALHQTRIEVSPVAFTRSMEVRSYLRLLRQRMALVIVTVVAGAAGGYLVTRTPPIYRADASIYVGSRPPGNQSTLDIVQMDRLIATYAAMVTSPSVAQGAVVTSHVARSAGQVIGETRSAAVPNTNLIAVTVEDRDPTVAEALANGVVNAIVTQAQNFSATSGPSAGSHPSVSVFQPAALPRTPLPTGRKRAMAVGAVFGLVLSIALVLLIDYLGDVEGHRDLPGPGTVPVRGSVSG